MFQINFRKNFCIFKWDFMIFSGDLRKIISTSGFSLLEVIVATGIITMGLLGILSLVMQNMQAQTVNRDYLIASMLAQEGIELVRNIRDTNWLETGMDWHDGIVGDGSYIIDYIDGADDVIDIGSEDDITDTPDVRLYFDGTAGPDGYYSHDNTGRITPFFRIMRVVEHLSDGYIELQSVVQWRDKNILHSYVAYTTLYDWR